MQSAFFRTNSNTLSGTVTVSLDVKTFDTFVTTRLLKIHKYMFTDFNWQTTQNMYNNSFLDR